MMAGKRDSHFTLRLRISSAALPSPGMPVICEVFSDVMGWSRSSPSNGDDQGRFTGPVERQARRFGYSFRPPGGDDVPRPLEAVSRALLRAALEVLLSAGS